MCPLTVKSVFACAFQNWKTNEENRKPWFNGWYNFFLRLETYSVVLRNNWYFSLNIKAHANENASKTATLTKNLSV